MSTGKHKKRNITKMKKTTPYNDILMNFILREGKHSRTLIQIYPFPRYYKGNKYCTVTIECSKILARKKIKLNEIDCNI